MKLSLSMTLTDLYDLFVFNTVKIIQDKFFFSSHSRGFNPHTLTHIIKCLRQKYVVVALLESIKGFMQIVVFGLRRIQYTLLSISLWLCSYVIDDAILYMLKLQPRLKCLYRNGKVKMKCKSYRVSLSLNNSTGVTLHTQINKYIKRTKFSMKQPREDFY